MTVANPFARETNDAVNLFLVKTWHRARFRRTSDLFDDAVLLDGDPEDLDLYLMELVVAWGTLLAVLGVICAGVGWLLDKADGNQGADIAFVGVVVVVVFCFVGAADAAWRHQFANSACRRVRSAGTVDEGARRLVRIARTNDATLVLQFVAAVLAASVATTSL